MHDEQERANKNRVKLTAIDTYFSA